MNKCVKRILFGLIIWAIPFVTSFFMWDIEANMPKNMEWFSAAMAFTWALGFAIAAYFYFKEDSDDSVKDGWITGVTWYVELLLLDLLFLVGIFGMSIAQFYPMLLTYLNGLVISVAIGYIKR